MGMDGQNQTKCVTKGKRKDFTKNSNKVRTFNTPVRQCPCILGDSDKIFSIKMAPIFQCQNILPTALHQL